MFHACVQRFDGMGEKFLGGELNRALENWSWNCASRSSVQLQRAAVRTGTNKCQSDQMVRRRPFPVPTQWQTGSDKPRTTGRSEFRLNNIFLSKKSANLISSGGF